MNNCPKCGNPLQAGITSCPICGTDISGVTNTPAQPNNVTVASVGQVPTPAKEQSTVEVEKVEPTPAIAPQEQAPVAPTQPMSVAPAPSQVQVAPIENAGTPNNEAQKIQTVGSVGTAPAPSQSTPVAPTANPTASIDPNSLAPTVTKIELATPVPSIPSSLTANQEMPTVNAPTATVSPEVKPTPKKKNNKTVIVVAAIVVVLLVCGGIYMSMNGKKNLNPTNQNPNTTALASTSLSSNGYKLSLQDGWIANEDGTNVVITNASETVAIKLDHSAGNISSLNKEYLENYISQNTTYTDTEVTETKISAKDAFVINTNINSIPVQIYFIGGGSNLLLGVSVIYQSTESKSKFEANVVEMIGTLSYADESVKAISTIDMYREPFSLYGNIIYSKDRENIVNNTTPQEQPENQNSPEATNPETQNPEETDDQPENNNQPIE